MIKMFDRRGDYVNQKDPLGRMMDSLPIPDILDPARQKRLAPGGGPPATPADVLHPFANETTELIVADLDRLVRGRGERLATEFARTALAAAGYDPDNYVLSEKVRRRLHNEIVRDLRRRLQERNAERDMTSTIEMMLSARDGDPVIWTGEHGRDVQTTAGVVRWALGMSVEELLLLPKEKRLKVCRAATRRINRRQAELERTMVRHDEEAALARTRLHEWLRRWNAGELRVERPGGSSLHHLLDYDIGTTEGNWGRNFDVDRVQTVVVENDWGASVPPVEGEWRVPFPEMCWEFRISGVRVLAFTEAEDTHTGGPEMWMVYGHGGHWVIDDYFYNIGLSTLPRGIPHRIRQEGVISASEPSWEMRRVAAHVYACIRSVCIMMDAEVARQEHVSASTKLTERRVREGRAPLRDHYVVKLVGAEHRKYASHARVAGRVTDARAPQRGHWRKGTWVHYDDQDSGKVQYVNDGGFVVSKTWRKWHFAGDPRNIIHKEYRA